MPRWRSDRWRRLCHLLRWSPLMTISPLAIDIALTVPVYPETANWKRAARVPVNLATRPDEAPTEIVAPLLATRTAWVAMAPTLAAMSTIRVR
jgi:hypothetical protein